MSKKKKIEPTVSAAVNVSPEKELTDKTAVMIILGLCLIFFIPFIFSDKMIYGSDTLNGIYSKFFYSDFFAKYKTFPRVLSVTLSGMPTIEAFMGDFFYPPAALQFIMDVPRALGFKYLFAVACAGLFMWILLRRGFGFRRETALFGAVAFMFNTQFISHFFPGHDGKMFVISYLPLSIFATKRICDTLKLRYVALIAFTVGMCILTSHVQTTYFSLWGIGLYFLYEATGAFRKNKDKLKFAAKTALFSVGVVVGLGIGMVQFLPPYEFTKEHSVRGSGEKTTYEHATSWSIHWEEAASFVVPEFSGFSDKDGTGKVEYWGKNPFKLNSEYAGIIVLIFSLFGLFVYRKDPFLRFWALIGGGALVFSLGANTPFFHLFYNFVPGVKLFRAPSMILFWFSAALVIGASHTFNRFFSEDATDFKLKEKWSRWLLVVLACCAGLTLIVTVAESTVLGIWKASFGSGMTDRSISAFHKNYGAFVKGAWLTLVVGGGALFLVSLYLKDSMKRVPLVTALLILTVFDLFRVDSYFYKLVNPGDYISRNDPVMSALSQEAKKEHFRVLPIPGHTGASDPQIYGIDNVLGFHDNEIRWYRDFTGGQNRDNLFYLLQKGKIEGNPFVDLLNVKYVLYRNGNNSPLQVARNATVMPRAFCVSDFEVMAPELMTNRLREEAFPYRERILLEKAPPEGFSAYSDSTAAGTASYRIDVEDRIINVDMNRTGFVVISDVYMPYWKATVNGKPTEVYRTNMALMAIPLHQGKHEVVLSYHSPYIALGAKITFAAIFLCILLLVVDYKILGKTTKPKKESVAGKN